MVTLSEKSILVGFCHGCILLRLKNFTEVCTVIIVILNDRFTMNYRMT